MSDVQEQVWLHQDYTYTYRVSAEILQERDALDAVDRGALQSAEHEFMGTHSDASIVMVQLRKSKHVTQEFDPRSFAPYEQPEHYYVAYIRVHYTPIDNP